MKHIGTTPEPYWNNAGTRYIKCISIHAMGQPVLLEKDLIAPAPMLSPTTDVSFGIFII
jgi:hypothetical protein